MPCNRRADPVGNSVVILHQFTQRWPFKDYVIDKTSPDRATNVHDSRCYPGFEMVQFIEFAELPNPFGIGGRKCIVHLGRN